MVQYNPELIQEFADRLYAQANYILIKYVGGGALLGLIAGGFVMHSTEKPFGLILAPVFGLIGFVWARDKVFKLKLEAQLALCQLQIEVNTRLMASARGSA